MCEGVQKGCLVDIPCLPMYTSWVKDTCIYEHTDMDLKPRNGIMGYENGTVLLLYLLSTGLPQHPWVRGVAVI